MHELPERLRIPSKNSSGNAITCNAPAELTTDKKSDEVSCNSPATTQSDKQHVLLHDRKHKPKMSVISTY